MWFICLRCYKIYIFEDKITYIIMIYNSFNVLFFTNKKTHCSTHSLKPFDILRFITAAFFINIWFIYIYIWWGVGGHLKVSMTGVSPLYLYIYILYLQTSLCVWTFTALAEWSKQTPLRWNSSVLWPKQLTDWRCERAGTTHAITDSLININLLPQFIIVTSCFN